MNKFVLILSLFLLVCTSFVSATTIPETHIYYFYSTTCSHCATVHDSGILESVSQMGNITLEKFEVSQNETNLKKFIDFNDEFEIAQDQRGYPFLVIEQGDKYSYLAGDSPIIGHLNESIINFHGVALNSNRGFFDSLNIWVVIVAALIDSINPCAFGVLLFLMAVLLSFGSSKRALKAGILYTTVIFIVYFLAGLGILKIIKSFEVLESVRFVVGIVVLIGAFIELKDFFFEGKGFSLKIPTSTKPLIEKYVRRGTLSAIFILGAIVALVELPCTGGIYLAILSLISSEGSKGILYLVVYNLIFVLPLILISYAIYLGAKVEKINAWVQKDKKYMRLAASLIMFALAASLLL